MALTRAMELLEGGACDTLVIDSAPTGHLLRLLELPELVDQWLKVFFALFLKYERVFRMPKLSKRMVALSRRLKALQKTLRDPHQSALYVVGILSELGFQETADLVVACERMGVCSPLIFLNLATPATDCTHCTALHLQERRYLRRFREAFPEKHHTIVYRQGEYRGPESLLHLSHLLYSDAHTHAEGRNP
jgi:arsenite-transporting ATPase